MKEFNRQNLPIVEREILEALEAVAEKHGISIDREGRGTFTSHSFQFKLKCTIVGEGGENTAQKIDFERNAVFFGFKPEHYGREFSMGGDTYRLVGFNFRARAMPFKGERVTDGAPFKFRDSSKDTILRQVDKVPA